MTAASFQSTVSILAGFGVPGELYTDSPYIVKPYILNSAQASYNIIGSTVFTITGVSEPSGSPITSMQAGVAQAGSAGTYGFAGFLVNPKNQALFGDGVNPLNPTLVLPNSVTAAICAFGQIVVELPAAANIGDVVIYDNTTGAISTVAPGTAIPAGKSFANATVMYYPGGGASGGLAIVQIQNPVINQ